MKVNQAVSHNGSHQRMNKESNLEVVPKAQRRHFSAQYGLDILAEADHCTERGAIGALLWREAEGITRQTSQESM